MLSQHETRCITLQKCLQSCSVASQRYKMISPLLSRWISLKRNSKCNMHSQKRRSAEAVFISRKYWDNHLKYSHMHHEYNLESTVLQYSWKKTCVHVCSGKLPSTVPSTCKIRCSEHMLRCILYFSKDTGWGTVLYATHISFLIKESGTRI
jgi:hypothetical protein